MKISLSQSEMEIWQSVNCRDIHCSVCPFHMNEGSDNSCLVSLMKLNFPKLEVSVCNCEGGKCE